MFDYIKIDSKLLPYISNVDSKLFDNENWQTKSLDKCLSEFTITTGGLLEKSLSKDERVIKNFHGIIRFYTSINETWYEFDAKFTDGKLESVIEYID